jgi:hypothetical protein
MDNIITDVIMMTSKKVSFNNTPCIIYEPLEISYDLHLTRINNYNQRRADQHRMEKLLAPILSIEHRSKMYLFIYQKYVFKIILL